MGFQDFIHLNVAMMTSNNALVPDPDKQDDLASAFWQWPILNVGLRMCGWDDSIVKYFLLGNPLVYWGSTAALGGLALLVAWYLVRWQRGYTELKQWDIDQIHYAGLYPVLGWFLHYIPRHGPCYLRPSLLSSPVLRHPQPWLYCRLDDEKPDQEHPVHRLRYSVRCYHRSLHLLHANLLGNGGTE